MSNDKYIGQNEKFGYWVQPVPGGFRVVEVRRDNGDAAASQRDYKTERAATSAAKRMLAA